MPTGYIFIVNELTALFVLLFELLLFTRYCWNEESFAGSLKTPFLDLQTQCSLRLYLGLRRLDLANWMAGQEGRNVLGVVLVTSMLLYIDRLLFQVSDLSKVHLNKVQTWLSEERGQGIESCIKRAVGNVHAAAANLVFVFGAESNTIITKALKITGVVGYFANIRCAKAVALFFDQWKMQWGANNELVSGKDKFYYIGKSGFTKGICDPRAAHVDAFDQFLILFEKLGATTTRLKFKVLFKKMASKDGFLGHIAVKGQLLVDRLFEPVAGLFDRLGAGLDAGLTPDQRVKIISASGFLGHVAGTSYNVIVSRLFETKTGLFDRLGARLTPDQRVRIISRDGFLGNVAGTSYTVIVSRLFETTTGLFARLNMATGYYSGHRISMISCDGFLTIITNTPKYLRLIENLRTAGCLSANAGSWWSQFGGAKIVKVLKCMAKDVPTANIVDLCLRPNFGGWNPCQEQS